MESALPVAADHPSFAGHFPGHPILPGVVLLAEVMAAVAAGASEPASRWSIASAKFLAPVAPGTDLRLVREESPGGIRFEVRAGERVVAAGLLARA